MEFVACLYAGKEGTTSKTRNLKIFDPRCAEINVAAIQRAFSRGYLEHFTLEMLRKDLYSNPCGQTGAGRLLPAAKRLFEALIAIKSGFGLGSAGVSLFIRMI